MKRVISLILIFALLLPTMVIADDMTTEEVTQIPNTDGSQSCAVWFNVFDDLLDADERLTNAVKLFLILTSLRYDSIETAVETAYNAHEDKSKMAQFGIDPVTIYYVMDYYMSTFPENIDDVKYNYVEGTNIYADLYYDQNFEYSKYMVRFHNYLNELFGKLPSGMQDVISKYDRKNAGEIVVMQGLMNIIINDYVAYRTYYVDINGKKVAREQSLHLRKSNIRQRLIDELTRVANDYPAEYTGDTSIDAGEIEDYIDALIAFGDVVLDSIEINLKEHRLMDHAIDLANNANLLIDTEYIPTQPLIDITLSMNTALIDLDSSDPLTEGYYNEFQLVADVENTSNPVVYTIDDPSIASVDENGLVTLSTAKQGVAVITATVQGYNVYKDIIVEVTEQTPLGAIRFYGPYISGYPDGTFKAEKYITRAEIATMMTRVLRLNVNEANLEISNRAFPFPSYSDVSMDHWAYKYIELAKQHGLMSGSNTVFRPDDPVTRAEMAVIIANGWEALGIQQSELSNHFIKDVRVGHWAFDAINKVYNAGIVEGYEDGTFRPDEFTNRGEIVVMINGIINRKQTKPELPSFLDILKQHWAYGFIEAATQMQIIEENIEEDF